MVFSMKKIGKQVGLTRRPVITVCYLLISARPAGLSPKVLFEPSDQPLHVLRQGGFEAHRLAGVRMNDLQAPGMQHLPPHRAEQGLSLRRIIRRLAPAVDGVATIGRPTAAQWTRIW